MIGQVNGRDKKCTKELVKNNLSVLIFGRFNIIQTEANIPMHVKNTVENMDCTHALKL
jgi:hypothetical protein